MSLLFPTMKTPLLFLALLASSAFAQTALDPQPKRGSRREPTADFLYAGQSYTAARVESVKGDLAKIRGSGGVRGAVPVSVLPPALATEARRMAAEAAAGAARNAGNPLLSKPLAPGETYGSGRVLQILSEGVLLNGGEQVMLLKGLDAGGLADGEMVSWRGIPEGVFKYVNTQGAQSTVRVIRVNQTR
jgi:hypothetical protein